jgi:hypothetical protein
MIHELASQILRLPRSQVCIAGVHRDTQYASRGNFDLPLRLILLRGGFLIVAPNEAHELLAVLSKLGKVGSIGDLKRRPTAVLERFGQEHRATHKQPGQHG